MSKLSKLSDLEDWKLAASRFLSQAYPIMSATMRSSSAAARQRCRPEITISDGKWGAILELVAAITRVFNITDEEAFEVVVNETDELARICELYKMASKELPKHIEKKRNRAEGAANVLPFCSTFYSSL